jgi:predicted nucleic acid-binding Zn ribbon protein
MGSRERDQHAGLRKLDGVLETVVSRLGLRRDLDDYRIFEAWERVVGEQIARNAQPVRLDAKRLVVNVKNPVWMQELTLLREDIRRRINEWMGRELVQELFLVLGPPHDDAASGGPARRPRNR